MCWACPRCRFVERDGVARGAGFAFGSATVVAELRVDRCAIVNHVVCFGDNNFVDKYKVSSSTSSNSYCSKRVGQSSMQIFFANQFIMLVFDNLCQGSKSQPFWSAFCV